MPDAAHMILRCISYNMCVMYITMFCYSVFVVDTRMLRVGFFSLVCCSLMSHSYFSYTPTLGLPIVCLEPTTFKSRVEHARNGHGRLSIIFPRQGLNHATLLQPLPFALDNSWVDPLFLLVFTPPRKANQKSCYTVTHILITAG